MTYQDFLEKRKRSIIESTLDCRKSNLRFVDKSLNAINSKLSKNNSSGYKGVTFHPQTGKWRASIVIGGKRKSLGLYKSKILASKAYKNEAKIQWSPDLTKTT